MPARTETPEAGQHIGKLRLLRPLGQGGMGTVFEAVHEQIGQRVAVKLLRPEVSAQPQMAQRFLNEARAVSLIRHPGVVYVSEYGTTDAGVAYLVMELLDGESLKVRLRARAPLPLPEALRLGRQIAAALAAAHGRGVIHRDLKPANVMVVPDSDVAGGERAKILDFGIAKLSLPEAEGPEGDGPEGDAPQVQTHSQAVFGTPAYMAPEQCRGARNVSDRADVYALGVMLYEMLSGGLPLWAQSATELMYQQIHNEPLHLREVAPQVPMDVAELVHAMLAKDAAARPSMAEVAATLERCLEGPAAQTGQTGLAGEPVRAAPRGAPEAEAVRAAPRGVASEAEAQLALATTAPDGERRALDQPAGRRGAVATAAVVLAAMGLALFMQSTSRRQQTQERAGQAAPDLASPAAPPAASQATPAAPPAPQASPAAGPSSPSRPAPPLRGPEAQGAPEVRPAPEKDKHESTTPDRRPSRRPPRRDRPTLRNEDIPLDPLP